MTALAPIPAEAPFYQDGGRSARIKEWLELSGPLYADMDIKVVNYLDGPSDPDLVMVDWDSDIFSVRPHEASYASWIMLRAAKTGDRMTIKLRCEEARGEACQ